MSTTGPSGSGPGRDEEHGSRDLTAVERMAQTIAADVARLEDDALAPLIPVLRDARRELEAGLAEWLTRADGEERYTAQAHRRGLAAIQDTIAAIGRMRPEMQATLIEAMGEGGELAAAHLREELRRFGTEFGQSIGPTHISASAIVRRAKHEIIPRIRTSSARYVNAVRDDMRHQLAIGLVKGETMTQMTNRLRRLGGPRGLVALRGIAGEPSAHVEEIAEGLFTRYRHWAERVVRTEVINAYNVEHAAGISEINATREDGDEELLFKWDSSTDARLCALCKELDGKALAEGKEFAPDVKHPPRHPSCRCVLVAWHPSWGDLEGEHKPTNLPGAKSNAPSSPRTKRDDKDAAKPPKPKRTRSPTPDVAATRAVEAGNLTEARGHVDRLLAKRGYAAHPNVTGGVVVRKLPKGTLGQHASLDGEIRIAPHVAQQLEAFARKAQDPAAVRAQMRALDAARKATGLASPPGHQNAIDIERHSRGMHVLVHESLHGFGPMMASQYTDHDAKIEEVATEMAARVVMRKRYGVNASIGYEAEVQTTVKAIARELNVKPAKARKILEAASESYKRVPMPQSYATAADPTNHLARAIAAIHPSVVPAANVRDPRRKHADGIAPTPHEQQLAVALRRALR